MNYRNLLNSTIIFYLVSSYFLFLILDLVIYHVIYTLFKWGGCITPIFSRDVYKYVAIAILCYIILFYCINLLFQFLN